MAYGSRSVARCDDRRFHGRYSSANQLIQQCAYSRSLLKPTEPLFTSPDNERAVHFSTSSYRPIHLPKSHPAKHRRLHFTTINQLCRIRIESPPRNTKQPTHLDCTPIPSEILTCQEQQIYTYPQMPTRLPDHRIKLPRKNTISKERRSLY
jgi:hypothetical protein